MTDIRIMPRQDLDMLGEGPIWSPRENAVLWVDILGQKIHRLTLATGSVATWNVPERIGWIIERRNQDGFVVGLKSGFAFLRLDPLQIEKIGSPEPDRQQNRLNDGKADVFGRVWAGSMDDLGQQTSGALYRLDPDRSWVKVDDGYRVANGPTFSPDYRTLYHTDTSARVIYAFDMGEDGKLSRRRIWVRFHEDWGYPDGMTTDADGCIWVAHWGGARISRFFSDGSLDRSIRMPVLNITSITFAGEELRRMFVTSAASGCVSEQAAGALFEVDAGVQGLPPQYFAG